MHQESSLLNILRPISRVLLHTKADICGHAWHLLPWFPHWWLKYLAPENNCGMLHMEVYMPMSPSVFHLRNIYQLPVGRHWRLVRVRAEVWREQTPWTVPEISRWYQRAPLPMPWIVPRIKFIRQTHGHNTWLCVATYRHVAMEGTTPGCVWQHIGTWQYKAQQLVVCGN